MDEKKLTLSELENVSGGLAYNDYSLYTVVKGDTLTKIAKRFNTTVDTLVTINHISDRNRIYVGQILFVPKKG